MRRWALLLTMAMIAARGAAQPTEPVPSPTLAAGEHWRYRVTDLYDPGAAPRFYAATVIDAHAPAIRVEGDTSATDGDDASADTVPSYETVGWPLARRRVVAGHCDLLDFPLSAGKTWTTDFRATARGQERPEHRTAVAQAWETVHVPAGDYLALRVVHDGIQMAAVADGVFGTQTREVLWYAPAVNAYVRREYTARNFRDRLRAHVVEELVEYRAP